MANISQNVNIEMLEKLSDGTYKRKYPKTRSDTGVTFDEHLADDATQAHLAKNIGLEDVEGKFVATNLEGAMSELFTNVSSGKDLVGGAITDVDDSVVIPADPTFNDLASAIGDISTGKKWASGSSVELCPDTSPSYARLTVRGLDFKPRLIRVRNNDYINNNGVRYFYAVAVSGMFSRGFGTVSEQTNPRENYVIYYDDGFDINIFGNRRELQLIDWEALE